MVYCYHVYPLPLLQRVPRNFVPTKAGNFNWEIYFTLRKTEGKDLLEKWVRERCRWLVFSLAPVHCTSSFSMDGILQPHGLDSGAFDKLETIADNFSRKILPRGFLRGVGLAYRK